MPDVADSLATLRKLQDVDDRLAELTKQRDAIPAALRGALREVETATADLAAAREVLKRCKVRIDELEMAVTEAEARIKELQTRQNAAKTNKEYAAFNTDIDNARQEIGRSEEAELTVLQEQDTAQEDVADAETHLARCEEARDLRKAGLDEKVADFDARIDALRKERESLVAALDQEVLEDYQDLFEYRKGEAVCGVRRDGICEGCMTPIPPQSMQQVLSGQELVNCTYCKRILYLCDPIA